MKTRYFVAATLTAVIIFGSSADADARRKTRKQTELELRQRIDSLQLVIEEMEADATEVEMALAERDSLAFASAAQEDEFGFDIQPENYNAEVTDSLLNIWYLHKQVGDIHISEYNMDSVRFSSNVPDSVYIKRIENMNSFIRVPYNDIVRNYIILYSEKMPTKMGEILGLCNYYMPIFQEIFDKYNMPEELKAMAVIESALNPIAVSRAGAKGAWQFMYTTAKIYNLEINSFVDERFDPVKSADAAARYLMDAYKIFGDWNLAISSYNCGAGNVNKAIRRSGGKRDFWSIYPYLPRETRGYVPAFVGALYAMTYYKEHGITPQPATLPFYTDTIHVNKMLHFYQVDKVVGIPQQDLKLLNPQYKHGIIPGNERDYILKIPYNYMAKFVDCEDSLYAFKADSLFNPVTIKKIKDGGDGERIIYHVRSGDYLGKIASRYRCSVAQIKRWNGLRSNNLRIGQRLVLYRGGSAPTTSSSKSSTSTAKSSTKTTSSTGSKTSTAKTSTKTTSSANTAAKTSTSTAKTTNNASTGNYTWHTVKNGESLYLIAKKYPGVSAQNIMDFNGISSNIRPGMKIKIPKH